MIDGLREQGGIWKHLRLVATGTQIGIREGRRIHGRYMLTKEDLIKGATFKDGVCQATFVVDIHSLDPKKHRAYGTDGVTAKPYEIPLRSLIAKDVDGLMMAGRCISGDFYAHASYRVTGNAVAMGQAAGNVAALAAQTNRLPHQVDWSEITA
jgi:succinate dehydrogenase/fumarate reductase flavoprotein subunit